MADARERRKGENENVFRRINERATALDTYDLVCECDRVDCTERIVVPPDEYEAVRAHAERFVVKRGHEDPAVERVIDERPGFVVVAKTGEAAEAAVEDDPRGG